MANNRYSSRRTRHIVRDAAEEGLVRDVYARREEQHAGILPKALDMRASELHAKAIMKLK